MIMAFLTKKAQDLLRLFGSCECGFGLFACKMFLHIGFWFLVLLTVFVVVVVFVLWCFGGGERLSYICARV